MEFKEAAGGNRKTRLPPATRPLTPVGAGTLPITSPQQHHLPGGNKAAAGGQPVEIHPGSHWHTAVIGAIPSDVIA